jgi:hypothetical protein
MSNLTEGLEQSFVNDADKPLVLESISMSSRVLTVNCEDVIDRLERIESGIEELRDKVDAILAFLKYRIPHD